MANVIFQKKITITLAKGLLYIENLCIIHSKYLNQFKPSQNRDNTFGFVYHFSTMTWFSDSVEIMSTNLFWTLFLLLLGIIIVEIFLLYHKLDPWITYWIMRSDTRKQLMDLEDRYTYTKKDSSIISINNWGKMCSCHFSQDISKWISSWVQYLSEDAQFCNSYIRHEKILLGPDHVQLNRLNTLHQSQPAEPSAHVGLACISTPFF